MTQSAMRVIGIFLGTLLLWLTVSIDWPSLLCMAALAAVPELGVNAVLSASFGNSTFAFLMFTFLCTYALSQTPFVRRCAVWFVSSRMAQKGPWQLTWLFFLSVIFLGLFISPTVLFVIYLPIIEEIYAVLGIQKGDKAASMLMMGLVFCCGISSGMTPIAHVFPLMAMEFYHTATGLAIDYAGYMAFAVPVGILSVLAMMLLFRFVLRPDLTSLDTSRAGELRAGLEKMQSRELYTLGIFLFVVALWVVPSMIEPWAPEVYAYINSFGTAYPPLLGAVALSLIAPEGKPLLPFGEAMSKGVPWGSLIMCAGTLAVGSAMTNGSIGLTGWISERIAPVASSLAPLAVVALFCFWGCRPDQPLLQHGDRVGGDRHCGAGLSGYRRQRQCGGSLLAHRPAGLLCLCHPACHALCSHRGQQRLDHCRRSGAVWFPADARLGADLRVPGVSGGLHGALIRQYKKQR